MRDLLDRDLSHRRRNAALRRPQSTGLEYGLIAAALAVAIFTVVAGLGARYGIAGTGPTSSIERGTR